MIRPRFPRRSHRVFTFRPHRNRERERLLEHFPRKKTAPTKEKSTGIVHFLLGTERKNAKAKGTLPCRIPHADPDEPRTRKSPLP